MESKLMLSKHEIGNIFWTMQNRKQNIKTSSLSCSNNSLDDLYATPNRKSHNLNGLTTKSNSHISPINRQNQNILQTTLFHNSNSRTSKDDYSPERLNTCSDRIRKDKTSLIDFKKLLLAKSAKSSPIRNKVSAVELLKKSNITLSGNNQKELDNNTNKANLDSKMQLLNLNASPKTFANRRMLRRGQFGSLSKSIVPKLSSNNSWPNYTTVPHTDVLSTSIPEDNIENHINELENIEKGIKLEFSDKNVIELNVSLQDNLFKQTESNSSVPNLRKKVENNLDNLNISNKRSLETDL